MPQYWLTPVRWRPFAVLGGDRIALKPGPEAESFRHKLHEAHPRLLMMFKANLLLSDEALLECGVDELPFSLDDGEEVRFEGGTLELSHCAEAFMDRLPEPAEGERLCAGLLAASPQGPAKEWLERMKAWYAAGDQVILLREDGARP